MAINKPTGKVTPKKDNGKPIMLKEVTISAKRLPKPDSVSSGYGAGKKNFAVKDVKQAVKSGTLKADTTTYRKMSASVGGNSDKAQNVDMSIKMAKNKKK